MFVLEEVHHTFSPLVAVTTLTAAIAANISLNVFKVHPSLNRMTNAFRWVYERYHPCDFRVVSSSHIGLAKDLQGSKVAPYSAVSSPLCSLFLLACGIRMC